MRIILEMNRNERALVESIHGDLEKVKGELYEAIDDRVELPGYSIDFQDAEDKSQGIPDDLFLVSRIPFADEVTSHIVRAQNLGEATLIFENHLLDEDNEGGSEEEMRVLTTHLTPLKDAVASSELMIEAENEA